MPLARPGLIALAIFTFMGNYQSFFWPLVMTKDDYVRTLPIGLLYFDSTYGRETNLLMAASVMSMVPLIVLFIVGQRFFVRGIQLGAVKG
jgi:ABC-type glycerol-3-phosphate transport system permease component